MGRQLRCALAGALPRTRHKATRIARPSDGLTSVSQAEIKR
jgi:hypothetical protein